MLSFTNPTFSEVGVKQLLWWRGYVREEIYPGKGPAVGCHRGSQTETGAAAHQLLFLEPLLVVMVVLKNGDEVENVPHIMSGWLIYGLHGSRFGPIQEHFAA